MRWPFSTDTIRKLVPSGTSAAPNLAFAFKLFRQLASESVHHNIFISPTSVMLSLWLLREGATGDTKTALDQVLELADIGAHALQTAVLDLKSALQIHQPGLAITVANSLWCNRKCAPLPDDTAKAADEYDAEVFPLDPHSAGTVSTINSWVFQKTGGKIQSILSQIDPLASLLVLNAIYFKGSWALPFDADETKVDPFHTSDGRDRQLPFMTQYDSYPYYEESSFQCVRLDYKTSLLSMCVFLPALRSSLSEFLPTLDCDSWQKWMRRFDEVQGLVRLPRFELTCDTHLVPRSKHSAWASLSIPAAPASIRFTRRRPKSMSATFCIAHSSRSTKRVLKQPP